MPWIVGGSVANRSLARLSASAASTAVTGEDGVDPEPDDAPGVAPLVADPPDT